MGNRLGIPKKYYDKMIAEAPELLVKNVNHWFENKPDKRMIRTLDEKVRAFLSSKYRPLDNFDLAESILPILKEVNVDIISTELTDIRFYLQAIAPDITAEIKPGDKVQAGVVISNSEVGLGSLRIEPMVYRISHKSGTIMQEYSVRKYHLGKENGQEEIGAWELYTDETKEQTDKAFWMRVQDITKAILDQDRFNVMINKMKEAIDDEISSDIPKVIEVTTKQFNLTEDEGSGVLKYLAAGGDLSRYGLSHAITRYSNEVDSYDRSVELQRLSGQVVEMPKKDWAAIQRRAA